MAKVTLNSTQLNFIKNMLEIDDGQLCMQRFASIMREEGMDPTDMPEMINQLIQRWTNRVKK